MDRCVFLLSFPPSTSKYACDLCSPERSNHSNTYNTCFIGQHSKRMSTSLVQTECDDGRKAFFPLVARWQAWGPNKRRHSIAAVEVDTHLEPSARDEDEHMESAAPSKRYRANTGDDPIDLAKTPQKIQRRNSCPAVVSVNLRLLSHPQIHRSRSSDSSQGECVALLRLLLTPSRDTGDKDLPAAHASMNSRVRPACEQNAGRKPQVLPECSIYSRIDDALLHRMYIKGLTF